MYFYLFWRMQSSGMLRHVALVRTDVLEELGTTLLCICYKVFLRSLRQLLIMANVAPSSSILVTLMMEPLSSPETLVLTRATRRNIPEDSIEDDFLRTSGCLYHIPSVHFQLVFTLLPCIANIHYMFRSNWPSPGAHVIYTSYVCYCHGFFFKLVLCCRLTPIQFYV
jgi:hypothetical protein